MGDLPPRPIGLALLGIYFERVYNAHLLFYRPRFLEAYLADAIPPFVLRAVFALACL